MLIGHNPGLHNLALVLASRGADLPQLEEKFPTGALATLAVHSDSWTALSPGEAELFDYVVPRQLDLAPTTHGRGGTCDDRQIGAHECRHPALAQPEGPLGGAPGPSGRTFLGQEGHGPLDDSQGRG